MSNSPKFYLTTPIYYVNARPHLGHTYTTIVGDAIIRRKKALGYDTRFLTGTDEHGQKIDRSAKLAGRTPQEFTDAVSNEFRSLWDRMHLGYNDFIRTTEPRHRRGVQKLFTQLKERGYIYKGSYTGQYCVSCELYVDAPPSAPCPDCGRITETVTEENYFFKLSAFERKLLEVYWDPERDGDNTAGKIVIQPAARRNEVLSFVRSGLKDLSVSRTSFNWGIPVPEDEKHVIYVWMDALANYITALGYGSDAADDKARLERYWPADIHLIGKEISRFHCVYWPAFLIAAGFALPKSIVAHGWLLFEESKMSKSRGNIVRSETILEVLGADALRYFLMREVVFGQDGSFSFDALVQRYNADLANGYGNLASRTLTMIQKYFEGVIPAPVSSGNESLQASLQEIAVQAQKTIEAFGTEFEKLNFSQALEILWRLIATVDGTITATAPWKLGASNEEASRRDLASILYTCAEALRIITALVNPVLPESTAKIWNQLGLGEIEKADFKNIQWGGLNPETRLGEIGPVFPRAEKDAIPRMQDLEQQNNSNVVASASQAPLAETPAAPAATSTPQEAPVAPAATLEKISIDDFAKVELRVAQVKVAERVPKADKLLRLEVDLGYETRQILAGIAEAYEPESLIGRKVVIVANLAPRKLRGYESNGMIVAASLGEKGKPVLAGFLEDIEIGARLK
jgi:methionyl-tRNA synthetase